jgi:hypothetical protein
MHSLRRSGAVSSSLSIVDRVGALIDVVELRGT